ncbi:hypothetical protein PAENIP36_05800 [Paenibacillus sp. P36]
MYNLDKIVGRKGISIILFITIYRKEQCEQRRVCMKLGCCLRKILKKSLMMMRERAWKLRLQGRWRDSMIR